MHKKRKITLQYENDYWQDVKKTIEFTPATDEQFVVKEVLIDECYAFKFNKEDVVLNIWGHIGCFDVAFYDRVKKIVTYEPCKENFSRLQYHIALNNISNVEIHNEAVSKSKWESFLYWTESGHKTLIWEMSNWLLEKVNTVDINDVFKDTEFTKIKCDCEGGEYKIFLWTAIPDSVDEMRFEEHTFDNDYSLMAWMLERHFEEQWFRIEKIENDFPSQRTYLLHCTR